MPHKKGASPQKPVGVTSTVWLLIGYTVEGIACCEVPLWLPVTETPRSSDHRGPPVGELLLPALNKDNYSGNVSANQLHPYIPPVRSGQSEPGFHYTGPDHRVWSAKPSLSQH
ncbi:hypothetical protein GN956_G5161 [Arapaima gigas]